MLKDVDKTSFQQELMLLSDKKSYSGSKPLDALKILHEIFVAAPELMCGFYSYIIMIIANGNAGSYVINKIAQIQSDVFSAFRSVDQSEHYIKYYFDLIREYENFKETKLLSENDRLADACFRAGLYQNSNPVPVPLITLKRLASIGDHRAQMKYTKRLYDSNQYKSCVEFINTHIIIDINHSRECIMFLLAQSYYQLGQHQDAIRTLLVFASSSSKRLSCEFIELFCQYLVNQKLDHLHLFISELLLHYLDSVDTRSRKRHSQLLVLLLEYYGRVCKSLVTNDEQSLKHIIVSADLFSDSPTPYDFTLDHTDYHDWFKCKLLDLIKIRVLGAFSPNSRKPVVFDSGVKDYLLSVLSIINLTRFEKEKEDELHHKALGLLLRSAKAGYAPAKRAAIDLYNQSRSDARFHWMSQYFNAQLSCINRSEDTLKVSVSQSFFGRLCPPILPMPSLNEMKLSKHHPLLALGDE